MRIEYPTYYDESVDTAYPFDASASRSNGQVVIEDDVFVDGRLFPPSGRHNLFISSIEVGDEVIITLADSEGSLGSGKFDRNDPPEFLTFATFETDGSAYLGLLQGYPTSGMSKLAGWPNGVYAFTPSHTRFAATVVVPQPQVTVRRIVLESGAVFSGNVRLVGEKGVQLTVPVAAQQSSSSSGTVYEQYTNNIRVDVVGDPLFKRRQCAEGGVEPTTLDDVLQGLVFSSTTVGPDIEGGIRLMVTRPTGDADEQPALRIVPINAGLKIEFIEGG